MQAKDKVYIRLDKEQDDGMYTIFPRTAPVVIIQTHSDDIIIHAGITARFLAACHPFVVLITATNDEEGVTDEYAEYFKRKKYGGLPVRFRDPSLEALDPEKQRRRFKLLIRRFEAQENALVLGLVHHYNMNFHWPVVRPVILNGRFCPYDSVFSAPTEADRAKAARIVKSFQNATYLMVSPQSKHPHHRIASSLFLEEIRKYSPASRVFFWNSTREKEEYHQEDTVVVYVTDRQEEDNEKRIAVANDSQNVRHFDPFFYSTMYRELAALNYTRCPFPVFRYAEGFSALDLSAEIPVRKWDSA
jgi:LmbE family N-acetylglucosaminyl deacetylase